MARRRCRCCWELIAWVGLGGIALEWNEDLTPWRDRKIAHGVLVNPTWGDDAAVTLWEGNGSLTAGYLAVLRLWAAAMAARALTAADAPGGRPVVAGNLHTPTWTRPAGDPMGAQLARQRPGVSSIEGIYGPGRFYNLGPRRHRDRLPGLHLDAPRLILLQGALPGGGAVAS